MRWDALLAILGMWAATYLCRAGGYAVLRAVRLPRFAQAMLQHLPGALFVAYVAPALLAGGVASWAGAAAVVGVQVATRNLGLAMLAGIGAAWAASLAA
nr:AzlD domain-containing protein [Roseomonas acroporae]